MDPIQNNAPAPGKTFLDLKKPDVRPLKGKVVRGPGQLGDEATQLKKAAKDFESVFMAQVLKGMRETVQKEEMFHGGQGEDMFEGLLDDEISKKVASQGNLGIGDLLYRDLGRRFHIGEENGAQDEPVDLGIKKFLPLHPQSGAKVGALPPKEGFVPLQPGAKADAAGSQSPPFTGRAADLQAQIRRLRQQGMGIEGATLKK